MNWKALALLAFLPLAGLSGCQAVSAVGTVLSINTPNILTPARLQQLHLTYETFQATAVSLRRNVPQCRASQAPSLSDLCVKRSTLATLQVIDRQAGSSLGQIDRWAHDHPTIDASALVDGFTTAVSQGQAIIAAANSGRG